MADCILHYMENRVVVQVPYCLLVITLALLLQWAGGVFFIYVKYLGFLKTNSILWLLGHKFKPPFSTCWKRKDCKNQIASIGCARAVWALFEEISSRNSTFSSFGPAQQQPACFLFALCIVKLILLGHSI
ncbi:hypothetical protein AMJ74_03905 [candidate division WOR_3 bacterium SM1_77]|uniref:Uncharacterized protein n=1 Tax=candidate division WOR_3 bacterium SM1_77 TaxID=1703778 RepID=A0A0S8JWT7_UNCW3|nr:MAG: hypothetical protein AMJ74_03905 [candidate division WOR_3 bacterium SM1_77]